MTHPTYNDLDREVRTNVRIHVGTLRRLQELSGGFGAHLDDHVVEPCIPTEDRELISVLASKPELGRPIGMPESVRDLLRDGEYVSIYAVVRDTLRFHLRDEALECYTILSERRTA